jgi:hypothetical protein
VVEPRMDPLVLRYLDGTLSQQERDELSVLLRTSASARQQFVAVTVQASLIGETLRPEPASRGGPPGNGDSKHRRFGESPLVSRTARGFSRSRRSSWRLVDRFVAAAAVLLFGLIMFVVGLEYGRKRVLLSDNGSVKVVFPQREGVGGSAPSVPNVGASSPNVNPATTGVAGGSSTLPITLGPRDEPHQYDGMINADGVVIRSGPADAFYPTIKLPKGTTVTVVGQVGNWLKIDPPKGSFSYVGKAFVKRFGDSANGVVEGTATPNVRAGSELSSMKTSVQTKLEPYQPVTILGEQDEFFKIEPPPGAYLYVEEQYVDAT